MDTETRNACLRHLKNMWDADQPAPLVLGIEDEAGRLRAFLIADRATPPVEADAQLVQVEGVDYWTWDLGPAPPKPPDLAFSMGFHRLPE